MPHGNKVAADDLTPHLNAIVDAVHGVLQQKNLTGVRVKQIHFETVDAGQCPDGFSFKCVTTPSGIQCGCFKD